MPRRFGVDGFMKSTHDLDVDGDGAFAAEDRGEHGHALLGESVRRVAATAATGF